MPTHSSPQRKLTIKRKVRMRGKYFSLLIVFIVLVFNGVLAQNNSSTPKLRRSDFPEDFIFGSATSAYQVFLFGFF